jgi:putative heme-binding domain-containing protein
VARKNLRWDDPASKAAMHAALQNHAATTGRHSHHPEDREGCFLLRDPLSSILDPRCFHPEAPMRHATLAAVLLPLILLAGLGHSQDKPDPYADHIARTEPLPPADEKKAFHLPPGFEAQLVAAEPDIHKPMNLAFDDRGRLWVTDTVEYPYPVGPGGKPRDTVKILDDFGPDGRARKITTFADGLNIPIGLLPLPGTKPQDALVFSIPGIYRLRDGTGTGRADQRDALYSGYGFRDTHGMTSAFTWGFDGWVYACHGYSNTSTIKAADGSAVTMQSGNTYRFKADGSTIEQYTWGQVNPFGLAFDPLGNLYSADCHSQPIYQLLRGAYYPSFGKPHDGLGFGPEMLTEYKDSTAIAGIVYYAADHFPAEYRDTAFIGDVVTHNIVQFRLTWHGSTPLAHLHYFLKSDDPWFRPVDLKLGPDGALYVADFYNRIIGHYEVPLDHPGRDRQSGRIWRIVYRGQDQGTPAPRADWTTAPVGELAAALGHPNLTVRVKAANQLVARGGKDGPQVVRALLPPADKAVSLGSTWQRAHGLWVLERCGALPDDVLTAATKDAERTVRVHAQRVLSERARLTGEQQALAVAGLKDTDANVQRAAADALGRHPARENVRPLLDLRRAVPAEDTHLLHVVRMALRDQLRPAAAWGRLPEECYGGRDTRAILDVALGVPSAEAAAFQVRFLKELEDDRNLLVQTARHVARYGEPPTAAGLLDFVRSHRPEDLGRQAALCRAIDQGTQERGAKLGDDLRAWAVELTGKLLASRHAGEVQSGVEIAGSLRLESQQDRIAQIAEDRTAPEGQRVAAVNALAAIDARRHVTVLGQVLADAASPIGLREHTARMLAQLNEPAAQAPLVQVLPAAPARLQNVIAAELARGRAGAEQLLEAVATGKASARLLQERAVEVRLHETKLPNLKERLAALTRGLPPADQKLQQQLRQRRQGFLRATTDAALGAKVFEKHCANCHQLGGQGAKVGPQLDGIGVRGLDRLLEDTLDPNRNVDQAFRLTTLSLKKGQVVSGLLLKEEGEVFVLADAQGKEVRVPKNEVEERATSQQSPMPANFADQVPEADFYHLLAFLLQQQAAKDGQKPGQP